MASILFSTIGQSIGGPLGAGIGAALGASVDASLFRRRQSGARDGFASRSAYGEPVPLVFGRTRVAGLLIWATAPQDRGDKGQGRRSQATSFAMALSRGPIAEIGRIWADGAILRNASGEFLTPTRMRLHSKGETEPDALIAAAEGEAQTPAFAALSYVVFESLDLGPFGNRIPSLSFEVIADLDGPGKWLGEMASKAEARFLPGPTADLAVGYAASFDPFVDDAIAVLGVTGGRIGQREGRLSFLSQPRRIDIGRHEILFDPENSESDSRSASAERPAGFGISYQDSSRDYQLGWQQEIRLRRGQALSASWPVAADGPAARAITGRLLREAESGADTIRFGLSSDYLHVSVGDCVTIGDGESWLVIRREIRGLSVWLEGRRLPADGSVGPVPTDSGRILTAQHKPVPPTVSALIEPPVPIQLGTGPSVMLLGSGIDGWRGAEARLLQGGDEMVVGRVDQRLPFGWLATDLPHASETLWDEQNSILVDASEGADMFLSREARDVLDGAGLVLVGAELVQYRRADLVASGLVRLSGLLRGRFGTGATRSPVLAGSPVMAVPRTGGVRLDLTSDLVGRELVFLLAGAGDPEGGQDVRKTVQGAGFAPLAPVHVRGRRLSNQSIVCSWVSRSRSDWSWGQAAESVIGPLLWHFEGLDGRIRSVPALPSGLELDPAFQMARFGTLLPPGIFRVEAVGEGPASLRFSTAVSV
jgi:hypothetical protein